MYPEMPDSRNDAPDRAPYRAAADGSAIVLAAGLRSPMARAGGKFLREDAGHLAAEISRELLARTSLDPGVFDQVILGCAGPPHDQANLGRVVGLRAGLPERVPGLTIARNCASGMEAVTSAATWIRAGEAEVVLAIGVEVMSSFPLIYSARMTELFRRLSTAKSLPQRLSALASFRPSFLAPRVALMEGLTDPISGLIMGRTTELIARDFGVTREESDAYAAESHARAERARDAGRFQREIVPVLPLGSRPGASALEHDDSIRDGQTVDKLAKLKPYFEKPDGIVTVGNSCGITDAAVALVVTSEDRARALGLAPLARIVTHAWAGLDPSRMGLGPVFSSHLALERAGLSLAQMESIELNEAFAAQVIACERAAASPEWCREHLGRSDALGAFDRGRMNRNGGAIALGHPVGATGARLLLTLAHELHEREQRYGLATLCIGGGQGGAVILEGCER